MIAVMSMWSNDDPVNIHCNDWEEMLLLWVWSSAMNRKNIGTLHLYLTSAFRKILIDEIGIKADYVSTELDNIKLPSQFLFNWWVAGKMHTYRLQDKPFIHIDYDAWFSKPLKSEFSNAEIFGQNKETFTDNNDIYPIREFLENVPIMPSCFSKYYKLPNDYAINVGSFGGNNLSFIHRYADETFKWMYLKRNRKALSRCKEWLSDYQIGVGMQCLPEQYGLSCMARDAGIKTLFLFRKHQDILKKRCRQELGYEHLGGSIKLQQHIKSLMKGLVSKYFPEQASKITKLIKSKELKNSPSKM